MGLKREMAVSLSFIFFGASILYSLYHMEVVSGVNDIYTHTYIIPNLVTAVLFDWRAFDTLGEALILVTSVLVTGMVFGKGLYNYKFLKDVYHAPESDDYLTLSKWEEFTPIIKTLALPMSLFLMALGIIIILGGHITPGGGFQGGALIAAAYILSIVSFGSKSPLWLKHKFLEKLETFGALTFMILGLIGIVVSGYYLFNFSELFGFTVFPSPIELKNAGIIPYLNISVGLKVLAGLSTLTFLLTCEKVIIEKIMDK
jgi:energy-converting hydrogenase B subunit I